MTQQRTALILGDVHNDVCVAVVATFLKRDFSMAVETLNTAELGNTESISAQYTRNLPPSIEIRSQAHGWIVDVSAVWNRRRLPPRSISLFPDPGHQDFAARNWDRLIQALERLTPYSTWINKTATHDSAGNKPYQLMLAASVGLCIPETVITNDPLRVRELLERHERVICKSLEISRKIDNPKTILLDSTAISKLASLPHCPAIFQECIPVLRDIRVIVVGDVTFAAEVNTSAGADEIDWRVDPSNRWRRHELPLTVTEKCVQIVRALDLLYGAIDLRLRPDGQYVFFETNPGGQYFFVEAWTGMSISREIARRLAMRS